MFAELGKELLGLRRLTPAQIQHQRGLARAEPGTAATGARMRNEMLLQIRS